MRALRPYALLLLAFAAAWPVRSIADDAADARAAVERGLSEAASAMQDCKGVAICERTQELMRKQIELSKKSLACGQDPACQERVRHELLEMQQKWVQDPDVVELHTKHGMPLPQAAVPETIAIQATARIKEAILQEPKTWRCRHDGQITVRATLERSGIVPVYHARQAHVSFQTETVSTGDTGCRSITRCRASQSWSDANWDRSASAEPDDWDWFALKGDANPDGSVQLTLFIALDAQDGCVTDYVGCGDSDSQSSSTRFELKVRTSLEKGSQRAALRPADVRDYGGHQCGPSRHYTWEVASVSGTFATAASHLVSAQWASGSGRIESDPAGQGLRVFPGKRTPADTEDRARVKIQATVSSSQAETPVYFRVFDVDDPSSDRAPLDPGGSAGNDNNGSPAGGQLLQAMATTDASGKASVDFIVTRQPGDNFRAAAALEPETLDAVEIDGTDLRLPDGHEDVAVTPLLTVWRKLHIEADSMGPVTGNEVRGRITGFAMQVQGDATGPAWVDIEPAIVDASPDRDSGANGRFENGTLYIGQTVEIRGIEGNSKTRLFRSNGIDLTASPLVATLAKGSLSVDGTIVSIQRLFHVGHGAIYDFAFRGARALTASEWTALQGANLSVAGGPPMNSTSVAGSGRSGDIAVNGPLAIPFRVVDDDQWTGAVPPPDTSLLEPTLAPAFVVPIEDIGHADKTVPFDLNLEEDEIAASLRFDTAASAHDPDFWAIYLLGAYQPGEASDCDPASELEGGVLAGQAFPALGAAVIYVAAFEEFLPSANRTPALTVAHEVGHLLGIGVSEEGLAHPYNGLMADTEALKSADFDDFSLQAIRTLKYP